MEKEINKFHAFFISRRVGGVEATAFPEVLGSLVVQKFGSAKYIDRLLINLAEGVALIMDLYDLRGEIDLEKLKETGIREDIICHFKTIIQLWARMDKALLMLARQKYEFDRHNVTSVDGMQILEDAIFAVSLHEFLENLDLFQDDKFMAKIRGWRKGMKSILATILESLDWEEPAEAEEEPAEVEEEPTELKEEIPVQPELGMPDKKRVDPYEYWRFSTIL